jgi:hypothetical protein
MLSPKLVERVVHIQKKEKLLKSPCPGYLLTFPDGQSCFTSYPFLLHEKATPPLPWSIASSGDNLILRSNKCSQVSPKTTAGKPVSCIDCRLLHDHNIVMGIRHRSLDGAHEKTPWAYLSSAQMYSALTARAEQINTLKLKSLSTLRTIGVRNKHIDAWKRLSIAIGTENVPRIRSLVAAENRAGASVFSIIEKVKRAALRTYSPRSYQEADYQLAYLIYKIGGRSAANIAQRALGLPSIDTSKRHVAEIPLIPSSVFPTPSEMKNNLSMCYPNQTKPTSGMGPILGVSIQIDEIKIQERLRWDPSSNQILGICREHGERYSSIFEFRAIYQADYLLKLLLNKDIHLATEVCG